MKQLSFFLICIVSCLSIDAQTSLSAIDLDYGSYDVGFSHRVAIDSSRSYQFKNAFNNENHFRPIPISIWYPASSDSKTKALSILNYLEILKAEEEWEYLPNTFLLDWFHYLLNTPENQAHLTETCRAVKDLSPLEGKHPVVVYTPSYQASSIENFALCEYLASHGYVVISSPSRGTLNRELEGGSTKDMETQSRDVEYLIGQVYRYPFIDTNKITLMGFSFGGLSNAITVMKHGNLRALISLDGTERYNYPVLEASPYFNLNRLNIPYLHMAQKIIPDQVLQEDKIPEKLNYEFQLYDSLQYADIYRYRFHHLSHAHFSSYGVLFGNRDPRQDRSDQDIMASYKLMSSTVLNFLEATIQNNSQAMDRMINPIAGDENLKKLVEVTTKQKKPQVFDYKQFNTLALKQNFHDLIPLYETLKSQHPNLKLEEGMLNIMGLHMSFDPKQFENSIKVFQLAIYLYPESANLHDSLAEAYLYHKDYEQAKLEFKRSLELNPNNENAVNRLKQLED